MWRTLYLELVMRVAAAAMLALVAGCASVTERAPLVTPELAALAAARGIEPAAAVRGRALYVGTCARCHRPVAVRSRTPAQWEAILPRMAARTQLDAGATQDLAAYVAVMAEAGR